MHRLFCSPVCSQNPVRRVRALQGRLEVQRVTNGWRGFPTTQMRTAGSGVTAHRFFLVAGLRRQLRYWIPADKEERM